MIAYSDSTGTMVGYYKYGPWGEPLNSGNAASWSGPRFRYTGQTALFEVSLYYYKARVYDPAFGRFLQTDPVGSKDDLDLYAYVGGDPINATDPTGMWSLENGNQGNSIKPYGSPSENYNSDWGDGPFLVAAETDAQGYTRVASLTLDPAIAGKGEEVDLGWSMSSIQIRVSNGWTQPGMGEIDFSKNQYKKNRPWTWGGRGELRKTQGENAANTAQAVMQAVFGSKVHWSLRYVVTSAAGKPLFNRHSKEGLIKSGDAQGGVNGSVGTTTIKGGDGDGAHAYILTISPLDETAPSTKVEIYTK